MTETDGQRTTTERPRRIIRLIVAGFALLVTAMVANAAHLYLRLDDQLLAHLQTDTRGKLNLVFTLHHSRVEEGRIISKIVREQNQKFCDFLDYGNIDALNVMVKDLAALHRLDMVLLADEQGRLVATYPREGRITAPDGCRGLLALPVDWNGVGTLTNPVLAHRSEAPPGADPAAATLVYLTSISLVHDSGDPYGRIVLVRFIPGQTELLRTMRQLAEAEVGFFDRHRRPVLTSVANAVLPADGDGGRVFLDGRPHHAATRPLTDHRGAVIGHLGVAVDEEHFFRHRSVVLLGGLLPLLASLLIALLLFHLLKHRVFDPILGLSQALRAVTRDGGDLGTRLPEPARGAPPDEVAAMTLDFNAMMARLQERTRDLEQARTAAEAASRAKSQFLANMSHEIRTPMNAILGMSRLALEEMDHDRRQHLLAIVLRSAENLLGLLNDILDLSRIEAGRVQLNPAPFALGPLLDGVVATLGAPAADKGIALDVELAPDLPAWMVGDELRLRQVLLNLVNNAIKFTPAGSVRLRADRREAASQSLLRLTVTDTGPGIPAEQLDRIFERFEQADNSLTRSHGGTGLGLFICRQLVALMGGEIRVESRVGAGSSFHCTLPLQPAEAPAAVAKETQAPVVRGLHILLVDDSEVNREVATMTLARSHRVTGASTGLEALALLAQVDFDAVLMDVQMPEMDGLAATAAIRAAERGETLPAAVPVELARALSTRLGGGHVPIVAMTAHAMDEDRDRCLAAGMDGYLSKPFQHEQLARVLGAVVGTAEQRRTTGAAG